MATDKGETVIGVFRERAHARDSLDALRNAGFTEKQIGIVAKDNAIREDVSPAQEETGNKSAEGAKTGAGVGVGVGALWGAGILAGVIPGVGPAIAGGILGTLLSSAAAAGAVGGVAGALVGLGMSEEKAKHYEGRVQTGNILVTVRAPEQKDRAREILDEHHAEDIEIHGVAEKTSH